MILCSPITLSSTGIQALLAWYLGNKTDEGIDARTTYHMIAAMISPISIWPMVSLIYFIIIDNTFFNLPLFSFPFFLIFSIFIYHSSNLLFLLGYDMWIDFKFRLNGKILNQSKDGSKLIKLIEEINTNLDVLK